VPRDLLSVPDIEFPGVYVDEVPGGVGPIEGVETSTTSFVGEAPDGLHGTAEKILSLSELVRVFGGLRPGWELGNAVSLFFANGGREAWVVGVPVGTSLDEGLPCLEDVDTLGLVCLPGETDTGVLRAALELAERRRAFLLVDPPEAEPERALALAAELRVSGSANGAVFYPPVRAPDPLVEGSLRTCPPSGAVAGMYARIDESRGVWKAPAGAYADLRGVSGLAVDPSDDEIAALAAGGVNCIRRLPAGIVVWGARTLAADAEWKYVNVRRLSLYLEESIERGTRWAVFEPNEEALWNRLRAQCASFLGGLFRAGAFQGQTSSQAYFVHCGRDTMTQDDIDQGRVNVVVGVAPVRPAEFVVVRIQQILAGRSIERLGSGGTPSERLRLGHSPVCARDFLLQVKSPQGWTTWTRVDELGRAGPNDRVFELDREQGELVFGDGRHGATPPSGTDVVRVAYRHGGGSTGTGA
jgi:phage tail sheath protein FI